jgi:hypothetical protein
MQVIVSMHTGGAVILLMRSLVLYQDYTRDEVHDLFDPTSAFTAQAGTWGLQGIIEIPDRPRDYVFFVTFGKSQAAHQFDEGIRK